MIEEFSRLGEPLGESLDGPAWDGTGLLFCLPDRSEIRRFDPVAGTVTPVRSVTLKTAGLAVGPDGKLYGAQARGRRVMWFSDDGASYYLEAMLDGHRHNSPVDLVVDRGSRIWFTDRETPNTIPGPVGYPPLAHNSVLCLERTEPGGQWQLGRITADTVAPGGIALSPDEATLYVIDAAGDASPAATLRTYPTSGDGPAAAEQVVHEFAAGERPGGLCADASGTLFVSVAVDGAGDSASGRIDVFEPAGALLESHALDVSPTNCCLGGDRSNTLFVTTAEGVLMSAELR